VLHVATVHWRSAAWIEPQGRALDRHLPAGARRWGCLNEVPGDWRHRFDRIVDLEGSHATKLNELAALVAQEAQPDDLLLFLDGDAYPVAPLSAEVLGGTPLAAVRRDENLGDPQPHPCFCLTTVGFWATIGGDWEKGPEWVASSGRSVTDVGARLWATLDEAGVAWRALTRCNAWNLHPLWFGLYGDDDGPVVYHHGAGFRPGVNRIDLAVEQRLRTGSWSRRARHLRGTAVPRAERRARARLATAVAAGLRLRNGVLSAGVQRALERDEQVVARLACPTPPWRASGSLRRALPGRTGGPPGPPPRPTSP
jgi:hypothetical protein